MDENDFEIAVIKTMGDQILDRPLSEVGGKGLFTKEIEEALLCGDIDMAVHSSKDMPTVLPEGLEISAFLPREDVRDAFISPKAKTLADLPSGAVVGTASLRRQAIVRRLRPDLEVVTYRGNVQRRLQKLADGVVDATLLAYSGLKRLGMDDVVTSVFDEDAFLPAVGQGAICIETRIGDAATGALLGAIHDRGTAECLAAERAFLKVLDGSCRTPIAGLARLADRRLSLRGMILRPDGSEAHEMSGECDAADGAALGERIGQALKERGGPGFLIG